MNMGIVNAGQLAVYDEIEPELKERVEDVILNRRADATERLLGLAERVKGAVKKKDFDLAWRAQAVRRYPYQSSSLRSDGMSLGSKSPSCVTSVAPTSSAAAAARRSIRPFSFPFDAKWNLRRA
jgi:hypothetical protein